MSTLLKTGCIIMASGLGTRFGSNKLMTDFLGKPLIQWILDATDNLFTYRVVVTRHESIEKLCISQNIPVILHSCPGKNDTIRLGLIEIMNDVDLCAFVPADQPLLSRHTLEDLLKTSLDFPNYIHRTSFLDTPGSPVIFPQKYFSELLSLPSENGGNTVVKNHCDSVMLYPVSNPDELRDIDTIEDLKYLEKRHSECPP